MNLSKSLFALLLLFSVAGWADDIVHATSEDIAAFDDLLSEAQKGDQPKPKMMKKSGPKKEGARANFNEGQPPRQQGPKEARPKGPPRDDRERGRRNPPPPPGSQPPPPPPGP